jgi:hypothetical protein
MRRTTFFRDSAIALFLLAAFSASAFAGQNAPRPPVTPPSGASWSLRNWMAYSSPYADFFLFQRDKYDLPLGSFLMPMRLRTPEVSAGRTAKIGFYLGGDASGRFESQVVDGGSRVESHSMFSGIGGGYVSGLNNPVLDKVDVGYGTLGDGISLELTGNVFARSGGGVSLAIAPKTLFYAVTPTEGSRGIIWYANVSSHFMFGRAMINVDPGLVRLPDGELLVGGRVGVPLPRGLLVFAGVPTNLPMRYQDVLPGAHPSPGDYEVGLSKGPLQIGAGIGEKTVYGLLRLSVRPARVGNPNLRPQGDGHVMLSADAEASHAGHGPNATPPRAQVSVEEELSVPPPSLIDLINDPLLTSSEPQLVFDRTNAVWQLGFKHSHRMMVNGQLTKMSMRVDVEVPKLVELLSGSTDATDGNSPEALARIRAYLEARVEEIIAEMQALAGDASVPKADRLKRIEPLYREGAGYAVLSGELRTQYDAATK